jgi:hypothetical protein
VGLQYFLICVVIVVLISGGCLGHVQISYVRLQCGQHSILWVVRLQFFLLLDVIVVLISGKGFSRLETKPMGVFAVRAALVVWLHYFLIWVVIVVLISGEDVSLLETVTCICSVKFIDGQRLQMSVVVIAIVVLISGEAVGHSENGLCVRTKISIGGLFQVSVASFSCNVHTAYLHADLLHIVLCCLLLTYRSWWSHRLRCKPRTRPGPPPGTHSLQSPHAH